MSAPSKSSETAMAMAKPCCSGRKAIKIAAFILGMVFICLGLLLVGGYVWSAIIEPWGRPDQSLLFWYLILPILGIPLAGCGAGMVYWAYAKPQPAATPETDAW